MDNQKPVRKNKRLPYILGAFFLGFFLIVISAYFEIEAIGMIGLLMILLGPFIILYIPIKKLGNNSLIINKEHQSIFYTPIKKIGWWRWFLIGGVSVFVLFIFLSLIGRDETIRTTTVRQSSMTLAEAKDRTIEVSYGDLLRNNEKYVGEVIYYRGKIAQVDNLRDDDYVLRINVTKGEYGFWDDDVWVNYRGSRVLEDDIVDFWGIVKGIKKYKTILGASRSVPEIDALHLEMADSSTVQIVDPQPQAQQQTQTISALEQQAPDLPGPGSRSNPIPVGTTVRIGDWSFKVLSSIPNATQVVLTENRFNDPPKTGHQFFMARVEATYSGSASDELSWLFSFGAVGNSAVAYSRFQNSCGVIPDDLNRVGEVFAGGVVLGNICWEVQTSDINSLVMFVDPSFSLGDSERVFMSLPK